jgi:membrane protein required for beta-lactamase induction
MKPLDPSNPRQLRAWASSLGRTHEQQIRVVRDLLVHAKSDEMHPTDLDFARAALRLLTERRAA